MNTQITLASKSQTRSRLLTNAKIKFKTVDHGVDEDEIKLSMSESSPEEIVTKLAEMKALKASISNDGLVIGSDQGLDLNGKLVNKAKNFNEAHEQLKSMSGKEHTLITATVVAKENNIIWKYVDRGKMKMRILDEEIINEYLESIDEKILGLVGFYAIEEEGIKLFERVGSDLFSIQGISMIPLTQFLWDNGMLFENNAH